MLDEDVHIGASVAHFICHIVVPHYCLDAALKHYHLVVLEVIESCLQDVLKLALALLHKLAHGLFRAVLHQVHDLDRVGVHVRVPELNLALLHHKQDQIVP